MQLGGQQQRQSFSPRQLQGSYPYQSVSSAWASQPSHPLLSACWLASAQSVQPPLAVISQRARSMQIHARIKVRHFHQTVAASSQTILPALHANPHHHQPFLLTCAMIHSAHFAISYFPLQACRVIIAALIISHLPFAVVSNRTYAIRYVLIYTCLQKRRWITFLFLPIIISLYYNR